MNIMQSPNTGVGRNLSTGGVTGSHPKKVTAYQIVDHGFESPQYFQGCGTAFTEFEDVATGIGDTARDAFEDALDSLAQNDWDTSGIKGKSRLSRQTVRGYLRSIGGLSKEDIEDTETSYHLSIRVKGGES